MDSVHKILVLKTISVSKEFSQVEIKAFHITLVLRTVDLQMTLDAPTLPSRSGQ